MTLRVVQVPNPAAGVDWRTVVPGQYVYHITGITAALTTAGGAPATAVDYAGGGNTLAYNNPNVVVGVPGYVVGDTMIQTIPGGTNFAASGTVDTTFLTANDLFFNAWSDHQETAGGGPGFASFTGATTSMSFTISRGGGPAGDQQLALTWNNGGGPIGFHVDGPVPAGHHMFSVRYDLGLNGGRFYLDGAPFGAFQAASGAAPVMDVLMNLAIGGNANIGHFWFYDEIMIGGNPSVDADWMNLYAQRGAFAAYTAATLAMGPEMGYHLDDTAPATGRQVTLAVGDGQRLVDLIPTGFVETPTAGTFVYSWQPNLNASTQGPGGTPTTVAIPDLILPAGYTIAADTLDLGSNDQWSNIIVWWNDDYMLGLGQLPPYANTLLLPADWAGFPR